MKNKLGIRLSAAVMITALLMGNTTGVMASSTVSADQACEYLARASDDYKTGITQAAIMEGIPQGELTRGQALLMLWRAFGVLPEPKGNNQRLMDTNVSFKDVPQELEEAVNGLIKAGILVNSEDGMLHPKESMPREELEKFVRRIYAFSGSNLRDDFYNTVNKKELETREISPGETDAGGISDVSSKVEKQVNDLIMEIANGSGYEKNSPQQKIKDFYLSALNIEERNRLGVEPVKKYLDALDEASTVKELTDSQILALKEIVSGGMFTYSYMPDFRDTSRMIPAVSVPFMQLNTKEEFQDPENENLKATKELFSTLLELAGESKEQAAQHTDAYMELMEKLLAYEPAPEDYADNEKINRVVKFSELEKMIPQVDVKAQIQTGGNPVPEEVNIMLPQSFEGYCSLLADEKNFAAIKTGLKINILTQQYKNLSEDFTKAFSVYNYKTLGEAESISTPEENACALVNDSLSDYVDRLYAEKYFSPEAKEDLTKLIQQFISVYKERIQNLDWLSTDTKKMALEKLDNMKFIVGYPDEWSNRFEELEVGTSFFENQLAVTRLQMKASDEKIENGGEKEEISMPLTMVNAYYNQTKNIMCFPVAILQAPNYDVKASVEENLASIGTVIAHEISHAFDNQGAKYDKDGKERDWWTKEDYAKFENLCKKAEAFYDGWEAAPGISVSGRQTLGENIADIGGMACALEVLKKQDAPDYDKFFRTYAKTWMKSAPRKSVQAMAEVDEHSPGNLRVNRVVCNFQEFYDTYGIKEGDGMYVSPEERIQIW